MLRILSIVLFLTLAACSRGSAPATTPVPEPVPSAGANGGSVPSSPAVLAGIDTTAAAVAAQGASVRDTVSPAEVAREAVEVFGDSIAPTTTVANAETGEAEEVTWDIDVRSHATRARVEHYVRIFSTTAKSRIEDRLERGSRYEAMIRSKLRAAGLPEDMYYLALIESGYDPHAYSRAAAVGMWQFMTATAKGSGLRVDWWVDERRDPIRSTDAAMKFLNYLNDQFGSLYLAAAAYNGGPGRIARGLKKYAEDLEGQTRDDAFFALAELADMPKETEDYVPQLIAAALVGKDPGRYGLKVERRPPFEYDSVRVPGATPLSAVATALGLAIPQVVELNSHILRGVTPPGGAMWVRVPVGSAASFDSSFAALDKEARIPWKKVTSKKGGRLSAIAKANGLEEKHLQWYNPKVARQKNGLLVGGQTILVPKRLTVAAALDVPDPAIEKYGTSRRVHIVKRGETLSHIARRYKTTTKALMRTNGLRKATIFPGQTIVVRGGSAPRKASAAKRSTSKTSAKKPTTKKPAAKKPAAKSTARATSTKKPN